MSVIKLHDPKNEEPPREVWVVSDWDGANFVSSYRQGAMEHASELAGEFPENGPYRVCRYVAEPFIVPPGWKLVPDEANMTDEQAEAIAKMANCCGGIAYDIYRAALEAAPVRAAASIGKAMSEVHGKEA